MKQYRFSSPTAFSSLCMSIFLSPLVQSSDILNESLSSPGHHITIAEDLTLLQGTRVTHTVSSTNLTITAVNDASTISSVIGSDAAALLDIPDGAIESDHLIGIYHDNNENGFFDVDDNLLALVYDESAKTFPGSIVITNETDSRWSSQLTLCSSKTKDEAIAVIDGLYFCDKLELTNGTSPLCQGSCRLIQSKNS